MYLTYVNSSPFYSVVIKTQHLLAFLLMQCIITEKQSNQINTQWQNKETGSLLTDSQN